MPLSYPVMLACCFFLSGYAGHSTDTADLMRGLSRLISIRGAMGMSVHPALHHIGHVRLRERFLSNSLGRRHGRQQ